MKKTVIILLSILPALWSCETGRLDPALPSGPDDGRDPYTLKVSCSVEQIDGTGPGIATRGIIGQTTITSLNSNFVKLDEAVREGETRASYSPAAFTGWDDTQAKITDATILSAPNNYEGINFRSVVFRPAQTYQFTADESTEDENDVVGYISRMVGWYPKTERIPATVDENNDSVYSDVVFRDTRSFIEHNGVPCIRFDHRLDGQTDVMVSDMREGRFDMGETGFRNNAIYDRDIQPYGHMYTDYMDPSKGFDYCNYFTFNHYLTGIRLYIKVDQSDLSLISWKRITNVVFTDQPQSVTIALPVEQARAEGENGIVPGTTATLGIEGVKPVFGEVQEWSDFTSMDIIRTPMAENDPDYPEFAETPDYPIEMGHTVNYDKAYLGYILAKPCDENEELAVDIHTDAGVVTLGIPSVYEAKDAEGNVTKTKILEPGHIYNIVIDLKTDGSLDVVLGTEDDKSFRNLAPYNTEIQDFEYSNCYVISRDMMKMTDESGNPVTDPATGAQKYYDGFYFQADVVGCGQRGMKFSSSSGLYPDDVYIDPHSVKILWQDKQNLISHVELLHGYVRFMLNSECRNSLEGNAVLAVYDGNDEILWSWHIWVESDIRDISYNTLEYRDYEDAAAGSNYYKDQYLSYRLKTYTGGTGVSMMNMNLGASSGTYTGSGDVLDTYGLYYQWGRKDPSPGPASYDYSRVDLSTAPYYYMDEGVRSKIYEYLSSAPSVRTAVEYPLEIIGTSYTGGTYPYDWLYSQKDDLWGYNPDSKKVENKTIYDPCPYGYRVADDEIAALFDHYSRSGSAWRIDNYGVTFLGSWNNNGSSDNFFPFAGWKGNDRGRTDRSHGWHEVGNLGDYQDARICKNAVYYENHRGRSMAIRQSMFTNGSYHPIGVEPAYTDNLTLDFANRTSASSVRCVRYDRTNNEEPSAN